MTVPRRPNRRMLYKFVPSCMGSCDHHWEKTDEDQDFRYYQCTICEKTLEESKSGDGDPITPKKEG